MVFLKIEKRAKRVEKNNIIEIKNKQLLQARTSIEKSTCFTKTFYATKHIFYSKPIDKI